MVHADPASDWPAVLTALDAKFNIQGAGGATRTVEPGDFFVGPLTTTLGEHEVLTSIDVPTLGHHQRAEYAKMAHPASGFAVVGAAVVVHVHDGVCTAARIAVGGLVPAPVRMVSVENALVGKELNQENIAAAASHASNDLQGRFLATSSPLRSTGRPWQRWRYATPCSMPPRCTTTRTQSGLAKP